MSNYYSFGFNPQEVMSIINNANMNAAYQQAMDASYMSTSIFNSVMPDFANMSLSTPAWMQNFGTGMPTFDFSNLSTMDFSQITAGSPYSSGASVITDENGEKLTMAEYAKRHGYEETMTDGVYKKAGKYYRYNPQLKRFAEVSKSEAAQVEKNEKAAKDAERAEEAKERRKANKSQIETEATSIAADVYDSIKGWGTNDGKLKATVDKINADNVVEVWQKWEENHEEDFGSEGGLMRSILDDVSEKDAKKYARTIKAALLERAKSLGLNEDVEAFEGSDLDNWDSYDLIVRAIKNAEKE